ncbi:MAG: DUF3472 domain-containing protein [Pedobacter sp.]|jgi:hypothetical protein|uniref:DUF3472 domain-containing protein n=1 Tax=Pedobacter sp. TaxID=1411316 RepID=UPI0035650843
MKFFRNTILFVLLIGSKDIYAQLITVPLAGNVYSSNKVESRRNSTISNDGIVRWTNPQDIFTAYVRVAKTGTLKIDLDDFKVTGNSEIEFSIDNKTSKISLNEGMRPVSVGMWDINDTGYVAIKIKGVSKTGNEFPAIKSLKLSGTVTEGNLGYVKDNEGSMYHFGRRGPSTHLNYEFPKNTDVEWFYNEVTVPVGEDILGSYFMANGFGQGYFGMQVNSPTERHILFSVWSPFTTDNPKEIPDDHKIKLIKKGETVHGGEFGGEGAGGQSYLNYIWKAGNTYRFLLHVNPVANNYSEYSAYFFAPELNKWQLIATFQRPQTQTYITQPYSFLENFSPNMGDITRKVGFNNQWICDTKGNWTEVNKATFTTDVTGRKGYRQDYQGGLMNGGFYLKIDGFFNDFTPYKTSFTREPHHKKPEIDFRKLP